MCRLYLVSVLGVWWLLLPVPLVAQQSPGGASRVGARELTADGFPRVRAVRVDDGPLIDGDVLNDPAYADKAATVSALAKDITEYLASLDIDETVFAGASPGNPRVASHSACSMQHGQKITRPPRDLLKQAGFEVAEIAEGHLCCGSAGVYNLLQPEIAGQLQERKRGNIRATQPDLVATGNIGCMVQIETDDLKVLHTVQLLDWAAGGPVPEKLRDRMPVGELSS